MAVITSLKQFTLNIEQDISSGHQRFRNLVSGFIEDSSVAVIVYDVTNRESFVNTSKWIEEVRTKRGRDVIIVLVGNKTDIVDKRQVSIEEGDAKARECGDVFVETSAKAGFNIKYITHSFLHLQLSNHPSSSVNYKNHSLVDSLG
ncbi:hypothetical protein L2E82_34429 [Cichorium intybus]|uniref:Uncharacterized protein n=1 Tax=Cichorium intybus TaxID=13427 RepID=A0ACB9BM56_CICIN|nr:hypothetical protein L2E82_34429 [Cichorium intybus]